MYKLKKISGFGVVIAVVAFFVIFTTQIAKSSTIQNMRGYAWNADYIETNGTQGQQVNDEPSGGMGWLSFNNCQGGSCQGPDYGVNVNANGNIVGYAWAGNGVDIDGNPLGLGWMKFGGLAEEIVDPDVYDSNGVLTHDGLHIIVTDAKLNADNTVTGWARFCAGSQFPNTTCRGTKADNLNGGWDGWVSLSGSGYGVVYNPTTKKFSGHAWGGNDGGKNVVGWIDFDTDFSDVIFDPITEPTVNLQALDPNVPTGGETTLTWTGINILENGNSNCEATQGPDNWMNPPAKSSPNGTFPTGPLMTDQTYGIKCLGTNGEWSDPSLVTVTVGVQLILTADNNYAYPPLYQRTLTWDAVPSTGILTNCIASSNATGGDPSWPDPANPQNNPHSSDIVYVVNPSVTYTLTCQNSAGTFVSSSVKIQQDDLPESVELTHSAVVLDPISGNYLVTLFWDVTNADSCTATASEPNTGWAPPAPPLSPDDADGSRSGVIVPNPTGNTYFIECKGDSGFPVYGQTTVNQNSTASTPPIYQEN